MAVDFLNVPSLDLGIRKEFWADLLLSELAVSSDLALVDKDLFKNLLLDGVRRSGGRNS